MCHKICVPFMTQEETRKWSSVAICSQQRECWRWRVMCSLTFYGATGIIKTEVVRIRNFQNGFGILWNTLLSESWKGWKKMNSGRKNLSLFYRSRSIGEIKLVWKEKSEGGRLNQKKSWRRLLLVVAWLWKRCGSRFAHYYTGELTWCSFGF